jgi:hypothetical protein
MLKLARARFVALVVLVAGTLDVAWGVWSDDVARYLRDIFRKSEEATTEFVTGRDIFRKSEEAATEIITGPLQQPASEYIQWLAECPYPITFEEGVPMCPWPPY